MKKEIIGIIIPLMLVFSAFIVYAQDTATTETGGEIETCIAEGKGNIFNNEICCPGSSKLANSFRSDGGCIAPSDGSFICADCGDGTCSSFENNCNCEQDCSCVEGNTKEYACADGTQVDWCICSSNGWVCEGSPESRCPHSTCAMPVCAGTAYPTGAYDENNCPVYRCPEGETCSPGLSEIITCSDGTRVQGCSCSSKGIWECPEDIENKCPQLECPVGCVCTNNVIACPATEPGTTSSTTAQETAEAQPAVSAGGAGGGGAACPIGCTCTEQTITCQANGGTEEGCAIGCKLNNECVLPGIRTSIDGKRYCDVGSEWKEQKSGSKECDNNFECRSNVCINDECVSTGLIQKILDWFKNLFG